MFKLYKAKIKVKDEIVEYRFWDNRQRNSKSNIANAGEKYLKDHPEIVGEEIQVLEIRQISYKEGKISERNS